VDSQDGVNITPYYDMYDSNEQIPSFQPISVALKHCRDVIWKNYRVYDKSALRNQKYYRILAVVACVCGTVAVLSAIFQLSGLFSRRWPLWAEIIAALIAFAAVMAGIMWSQQKKWLLDRVKAEQYRTLKFLSLIHPDLWTGNIDQWKDKLAKKAEEIRQMNAGQLRQMARKDYLSQLPKLGGCRFSDEAILAMLNYYEYKRLKVQMAYFRKKERQNEIINQYTRNVPYLLYFLSVVAVLGHFIVDIFSGGRMSMHATSIILIIFAAALPVLAAGFRTLRSAYEFARSASIFQAKYTALERFSSAIAEEAMRVPLNKEAILDNLWQCEYFLEAENREWLRLMMEAEWFI
jgi:hypothetical protein